MSPIHVRLGFDPATAFDTLYGSSDGFAVDAEELDRIEVRLPADSGHRYTAYLRALGDLRPLPAGAAFDAGTGTFTWQPAAGFIGPYDLVFVAAGPQGIESRHEVRITLRPRQR
jgi:hypothetical protein